ncbi:hypothetical protein IJ843_07300 [bacterium]|nr:hypothetical protein [bacterium]
MVLDVKYRKNTLFVQGKPLNFDFEVGNALAVDDKVIFLLKIPYDNNTLKNIYCLSDSCQFIWQVQSVLEAYPDLNEELPFENMVLRENGNISASDFYGRNFDIDTNNGKILDFKIAR